MHTDTRQDWWHIGVMESHGLDLNRHGWLCDRIRVHTNTGQGWGHMSIVGQGHRRMGGDQVLSRLNRSICERVKHKWVIAVFRAAFIWVWGSKKMVDFLLHSQLV